MDFKPENFFIGVTEFFSVILPGALLTWFFMDKVRDIEYLNNISFYDPQNDSVKGAAFLLVAYITGHLIYVFASMLDSWLYNPLRNIIFRKNNDYAFKTARQIKKRDFVNDRGLLEDIFKSDKSREEKLRNKKWYCAKEYRFLKLCSSIRDSVFFWNKRCNEEMNDDAFKDSKEVMNTYKWGQHYLEIKYPQLMLDVKRLEADSKFFRSLVIAFSIIAIYYFTIYQLQAGLILLVLVILSFYRFGDLRYKSTNLVYELIITTQHLN